MAKTISLLIRYRKAKINKNKSPAVAQPDFK